MAEYSPSKIIKDGNTYNFRDTTKIPLAGSNQISGSLIPATDNVYKLGSNDYRYVEVHCNLFMGSPNKNCIMNYERGGFVVCRGANVTGQVAGQITLSPWTSKSNYQEMYLSPDGSWWWTGQAVQIGSDARLKQQISEIDDKLLDAWQDVDLVQFKYNDAVEQKGKDKARLHTGFVVQQIDKACKSHGVDISEYGLYCHEEYPEETEEVEVEQKDGTKTKERKVIREASEHYSLRYTEALIVECAYLRKCIKELRNEIEELKSSK